MFPILYIGITSFISSFIVSNSITREYLRYRYENEIINQNKTKNKKDSKVKFKKNIRVIYIPNISNSGINTSKIWYKIDDYKKFKQDYIQSKYNSI